MTSALDIAPRWMLVFPKWRAMVEQIDRGEVVRLPRPSHMIPTEAAVQMAELASRVGGTAVWVEPEA